MNRLNKTPLARLMNAENEMYFGNLTRIGNLGARLKHQPFKGGRNLHCFLSCYVSL